MTSIDEALATNLADFGEPYLGREVSSIAVKITKAGDGLSKQLGIAPQVFQPGQKVMVLLECEAGAHTHKPIDKADTWELVETLEAVTATIVTDKASESKLRTAADRVAKAAEGKKGTQRLDGTDAEDLEHPDPDWGEGSEGEGLHSVPDAGDGGDGD